MFQARNRFHILLLLFVVTGMQVLADPPPAATTAPPNSTAATPPSSPNSGNGFWNENTLGGNMLGLRSMFPPDRFSIALDWISQGFANFEGGVHQGTIATSTLDLKLSGTAWSGSQFYFDLEDHAGPDPSAHLAGDIQRFSNLNSKPFFQVAQFWYQQTLFNGELRLKIGKIDANNDFSVIDNGASFLNSSAQISPTVVDFPTYPNPTPGVTLIFTPSCWYYVSLGAFEVTSGDKFLDFTSEDLTSQLPSGGVFAIAETGFKWNQLTGPLADGNLRLGFWDETGTLQTFEGSHKHGTQGFYAITNQTLWRPGTDPNEVRGLRTFLEYGETPGDVSIINRHIGAGLDWTGPLSDRSCDVIGIGPEYVHFSDKAGLPKTYELALEAFYQYQIAPWASVQPDLQYIIQPGGEYSNAFVGTLQMTVHF